MIVSDAAACLSFPDGITHHTRRKFDLPRTNRRQELFKRERGSDSDFQVGDGCVLLCESAEVSGTLKQV